MLRILLIDDDPLAAKLLDAFLIRRFSDDYVLTHVRTLEEALLVLGAKEFDEVLLDNRLRPYADFTETLPAILATAPDAQPIVVSASPMDDCFEMAGLPPCEVVDKFDLRKRIDGGLLG